MEGYQQSRTQLVELLKQEGISNPDVLQAIATVPRHKFTRIPEQAYAYENIAIPIDCQQTISQPYVVARMTEAILRGGPVQKVLEIGTGSGYQAAVLSQIVDEVYSVERIRALLDQAEMRFAKLGYGNIHTHYGDGFLGWPAHSPYDGIIVTAGAPEVPQPLLDQLADSGRMIIPVDSKMGGQDLQLIHRRKNHYSTTFLDPVVFVPLLQGTE